MVINVEELRKIIREEVRRTLLEVLTEFLPLVDEEEQKEIERIAGKPSDYKEDFVEWKGQ